MNITKCLTRASRSNTGTAGAGGGLQCSDRNGCSGGTPYGGSSGRAGGGLIYIGAYEMEIVGSIEAYGGNGGDGGNGAEGTRQGCEGGGGGGT